MSHRYLCDRCGKPIDYYTLSKNRCEIPVISMKMDVCTECYVALDEAIDKWRYRRTA